MSLTCSVVCLLSFPDRIEGDRSEGSGQENEDEQ